MNMQFRPAKVQRSKTGIYPSEQKWGDIGPAPKSCRWPLWGDEKPTHVYCGDKVAAPGQPYCESHAKKAQGQSTGQGMFFR